MLGNQVVTEEQQGVAQSEAVEPLLYALRKYPDDSVNASTTSCQKTSNPADYGPDD